MTMCSMSPMLPHTGWVAARACISAGEMPRVARTPPAAAPTLRTSRRLGRGCIVSGSLVSGRPARWEGEVKAGQRLGDAAVDADVLELESDEAVVPLAGNALAELRKQPGISLKSDQKSSSSVDCAPPASDRRCACGHLSRRRQRAAQTVRCGGEAQAKPLRDLEGDARRVQHALLCQRGRVREGIGPRAADPQEDAARAAGLVAEHAIAVHLDVP